MTLALSCHKKTTPVAVITDSELQALNYIPAKVTSQSGLAGCGFMLILEDGQMLEPVNLNDTLKQDQLRLWVKYQVEKKGMSVCMMGTMVRVQDAKFLR